MSDLMTCFQCVAKLYAPYMGVGWWRWFGADRWGRIRVNALHVSGLVGDRFEGCEERCSEM